MKIGIFFTMRKANGGAYQYAVTFVEALTRNPAHTCVIFNSSPDLPAEFAHAPHIEVVNFAGTHTGHDAAPDQRPERTALIVKSKIVLYHALLRLRLFGVLTWLTQKSQRKTIDLITSKKIDLAIFTMSNKLAFLLDLPTIVPIHDINHKLHPQYPEFSAGKTWVQREYITSQTVKKASTILVDSEVSREDIIAQYHAQPDKLVVLPFLSPNYLHRTVSPENTKHFFQQHSIPKKFLFYPAQLWPHKNHSNLVKAIGILQQQGLAVTLILTGAKKEAFGVWDAVTRIAKDQHIENQVKFLGYVEDDEITMLYRNATAMVMPALVGPTYIPIYEAWSMRCPVACSDIRGLREQAGDAALLFNPENPADIADKIKQIWTDDHVRQDLIARGTKRLSLWTDADFRDRIHTLLQEFKSHAYV
ncbi:MAG: Glycosyl transferase group 1 [Candidatus Kaiserbacteria bacterium GW2011_GWA2_49_19]|uniref:Glycosyl transferase group 1 n=1 Tax=Candidatus Kaiserbacteria bacterium GW2011_GWA2_49_19 TaxID=1618669 RepID=A0A0G1YRU5_9BACT|nr:MAG: Glycosyl transferase group 1 [Candidatus Kaiserbacteria bacterium GW2011_GWA2_49_19]